MIFHLKISSHLNNETILVSSSGYFCPQCDSKYCEIPIECKACGLTLVCAPHLARSYHHLFPLSSFQEIKVNKDQELERK
jgi:transcription initiation factor TFIIH subunit 2